MSGYVTIVWHPKNRVGNEDCSKENGHLTSSGHLTSTGSWQADDSWQRIIHARPINKINGVFYVCVYVRIYIYIYIYIYCKHTQVYIYTHILNSCHGQCDTLTPGSVSTSSHRLLRASIALSLHDCTSVCVYLCMYLCMYVHSWLPLPCHCTTVRPYVCIYTCVCIGMHTHALSLHDCLSVCVCVCMYVLIIHAHMKIFQVL
jgi:hypothetical protein